MTTSKIVKCPVCGKKVVKTESELVEQLKINPYTNLDGSTHICDKDEGRKDI